MHPTELVHYLTKFLATRRAKKLCGSYHAEPVEALGDLYSDLSEKAMHKEIINPGAWISCNGFGLLQNWLRREARPLSVDSVIDCAINEESISERTEVVEIVARELALLPQREKEAIEAYADISADSCRALAKRRGVSTQTVCNWARTAIAKLRPQLESCL